MNYWNGKTTFGSGKKLFLIKNKKGRKAKGHFFPFLLHHCKVSVLKGCEIKFDPKYLL